MSVYIWKSVHELQEPWRKEDCGCTVLVLQYCPMETNNCTEMEENLPTTQNHALFKKNNNTARVSYEEF